jgi:Bacterial regulatory proteins, tetR family
LARREWQAYHVGKTSEEAAMPRARKSTAKPAAARSDRQTTGADVKARLIKAALDLAARRGWRHTGMGEIANEAGVPLHEAHAQFGAKPCLLAGFVR